MKVAHARGVGWLAFPSGPTVHTCANGIKDVAVFAGVPRPPPLPLVSKRPPPSDYTRQRDCMDMMQQEAEKQAAHEDMTPQLLLQLCSPTSHAGTARDAAASVLNGAHR